MKTFSLCAALLLACAACAAAPGARRASLLSAGGPGTPAMAGVLTRGELVDLFVRLREAERRRDPDRALQALHFLDEEDRRFYLKELYYLASVPAGPVCAASEVHLACAPPGHGPGDYCFLEPVQGAYQASMVTVVEAGGRPRVLYRRPDLTEEERVRFRPGDLQAIALRRRAAHWRGLRGAALRDETARLKIALDHQAEAQAYAARTGLRLAPFSPDPRSLLAELGPLSPEETRVRVLAMLAAPAVVTAEAVPPPALPAVEPAAAPPT